MELQRVLEVVGPPLARLVVSPTDPACDVGDLVIAEPTDLLEIRTGDIVLGVAIDNAESAVELIESAGEHGAAALLLKDPIAAEETVTSAAGKAGVALLAVEITAAWTQVLRLLHSILDTARSATVDIGPRGAEFDDLFTLADTIATVIDAPVTIEDAHSRVLAYSARQEEADAARVATIVGRRVPDATLRQFRRQGVLREVGEGVEPIYVPGLPDGTRPRLIMPVRAGSELLGSIWAVVPGPVARERAAAFADTATVVALHLLRIRAGADVERRLVRDLVATAIHTPGSSTTAAVRLGLRTGTHRVIAFGLRGAADDQYETLLLALAERLRTSCGLPARTPLAEVSGAVYVIAEAEQVPSAPEWISRAVGQFSNGVDAVAAIGGAAATFTDLPRSRAQADETLSLLRHDPTLGTTASYQDAWASLVVHRIAGSPILTDLLAEGPLDSLLRHDADHGTSYVDTLAAWLGHGPDQNAVAAALHIHRNTLRYRMQRIAEVVPLHLDDQTVRLALQLQLTVLRRPSSL